ncbi:HNH endonuclease [Segniliparus rotundus DSM 44985]|uniref:HNH endonuclease n=1 Tax=Segniliparus rotundus (strain ATCC BAA-972 / CDC 1076 / CIP 108378 / DSM 44985 / JCM 13578) TaxID=640132 RepID=D6Z9M6_SEGRD|nr:HNH endonuclease signature motif containing protein [Segniliparus rotundus]ADG96553.1 HNH endonuclease [Segniliparus rotundus DSM 44985]
MGVPRSTTKRDADRKTIARGKPPCGICGGEIDYALPHTDPASFVADHIVPLNKGGADVLANKQPAHRDCNRAKSDTAVTDLRRRYVTERAWA